MSTNYLRPKARRPAERSLPEIAHRDELLGGLMRRAATSRALFAMLGELLPATLFGQLRAGSFDAGRWTVVCLNAAAAKKLQQMLPTLVGALQARGAELSAINLQLQAPRR